MGTRSPQWVGQLGLAPGTVFYSGPGGRAEPHHHLAVQLVRTHTNPFVVTLGQQRIEAGAALIPSGVRHSFESDSPIDLVLVEPEGAVGSRLQELAVRLNGQDLSGRIPAGSVDPARVIECLSPDDPDPVRTPATRSPAVGAAVEYIEHTLDGRPKLEEAAANAHISSSRLTHLFTAEIGIPFRSYVLWARLRRVVLLVGEGDNLTRAAHGAGFSDSAHLSRVFRGHFGLSPSALLQMELSGDWLSPA
ncbi:MAG: helix-turn-helix domain-containing protein [Solirubrobacterales bacterium]|nr:helix-turn-helix domain-containing protein [Solirubrobacterales bacterium]